MSRSRTIGISALGLCVLAGVSVLAYRQGAHTQLQPSHETETRHSQPQRQLESESFSKASKTSNIKKSQKFQHLTDASIRWQIRVDFLKNLDSTSLSASDIQALYALLNHQPESHNAEGWWVVVNEIMEQMRLQGIGEDRYSHAMLDLIEDSNLDGVLRDYAAQHLGLWLAPEGDLLPTERDSAVAQQAIASLVKVTTDPSNQNTSVPGTALIALIGIEATKTQSFSSEQRQANQEQWNKLRHWLHQVLDGSVTSSKETKISVINAAGLIGAKQTLPQIRQFAQSSNVDAGIRLSSIATLGQLGSKEDIATLRSIVAQAPTFHHAAQAAIQTIQHR